jgi:nucleoside-diphosphate-sugar epimerase
VVRTGDAEMRILVTGSQGTIGTPLTRKLRKLGNEVIGMDIANVAEHGYRLGNVNDFASFAELLAWKPGMVFHLAGEVSNDACEQLPDQTLETNLIGLLNALRFCKMTGARLLFTSSSQVYANLCSANTILTEDMVPLYHSGIYGITNWMGEELVRYFIERYSIEAIIVRIFMSYGPGEYPNRYRSAISRFIQWALEGNPIIVHRGAIRSWCYIDDIVDGIIAAADYHRDYEVFNIGRDEYMSMDEVAKKIIYLTGSESEIAYEEAPKYVILKKIASFEKAKRLLGWQAKVPLEEGLRKTVEWNRKEIRIWQR